MIKEALGAKTEINPYLTIAGELPPVLTMKARAATLVNIFEGDHYPKTVFAASDIGGLRAKMEDTIRNGLSVGVATCFADSSSAIVKMPFPDSRLMTSPYWVGIREKSDIDVFFEGKKDGENKYWGRGYDYYLRQDAELLQAIITEKPVNYGENDEDYFILRVRRNLPGMGDVGGFRGEMRVGTWCFRDLEGGIKRRDLITFFLEPGDIGVKAYFGSVADNESVRALAGEVFKIVFGRWMGEPVHLPLYYDALDKYGFDTLEMIGERQGSCGVYCLKLFEVR